MHRIKRLKKDLPDNILQKIADIRVLALDRACADIKKDITAYCEANKKAVESAMNEYRKENNKSFNGVRPAFADNLDFHDCKVVSCRKNGKSTILSLDNSGGFTTISKIIFKDCSILKQDAPLHGAWWLYEEIYKAEYGYEIHVLLKRAKLIDFIITATDVELGYKNG